MTGVNQTDSPAWPFSVPFGWFVEWDRPRPATTLWNDALFRAERGVNFRDVCRRVLIFLPLFTLAQACLACCLKTMLV
jgi:hypothetical protein